MTFVGSGDAKVHKDPVIQCRIDEENFVCPELISSEDVVKIELRL